MNEPNKTKLCPYCKSIIDRNAVICVKCGKQLPNKKRGCISGCVLSLISVFAILMIIGILASDDIQTTQTENIKTESVDNSKTEKEEISYISVRVDDMVQLLEENALKAERQYQDAYVEITGVLGVIDSDGAYISLEPSDSFSFFGVQCFIKNDEQLDKVLEMKIGDTVTLRGKITSIGEILGYHLDIHSID